MSRISRPGISGRTPASWVDLNADIPFVVERKDVTQPLEFSVGIYQVNGRRVRLMLSPEHARNLAESLVKALDHPEPEWMTRIPTDTRGTPEGRPRRPPASCGARGT